ncbi:hypothetical protein [Pseudomonas sp. 22 E 5]|nr:hypothetical protein [Pseudomonas sp. 22 E 5]
MGRGLSGTRPQAEHCRHQPGSAWHRSRDLDHHRPVFGADVPARVVHPAGRSVFQGQPWPVGVAQGQPVPDAAAYSALHHHRSDRGCVDLAVLRLARRRRHRHPDPDLRVAGPGPEHRGGPCRSARPRLCGFLCRGCLHLRAALTLPGLGLLDLLATGGHGRRYIRLPAGLPGAAPAR